MPRTAGTTTKAVEKKEGKSKNFLIRQREGTTLFNISYEGGGEVPAELAGLYTTEQLAEAAVARYKNK